jgi:hypothetical protein
MSVGGLGLFTQTRARSVRGGDLQGAAHPAIVKSRSTGSGGYWCSPGGCTSGTTGRVIPDAASYGRDDVRRDKSFE